MAIKRPVDYPMLDYVFQPLCNVLGERQFDVARFLADGGCFLVIVGLSLAYLLHQMSLLFCAFGLLPMLPFIFFVRWAAIRPCERETANGRPNTGRYALESSRLIILFVILTNAGLDWSVQRFNVDGAFYLAGWIIIVVSLYLTSCQRPPPKPVIRRQVA